MDTRHEYHANLIDQLAAIEGVVDAPWWLTQTRADRLWQTGRAPAELTLGQIAEALQAALADPALSAWMRGE